MVTGVWKLFAVIFKSSFSSLVIVKLDVPLQVKSMNILVVCFVINLTHKTFGIKG